MKHVLSPPFHVREGAAQRGVTLGWIVFDQRLEEACILKVGGRSLFVCQHFESTCKDIVSQLCLTKALCEEKFEFLDDVHHDYVRTLFKQFLGNSIKRLWKDHPAIPADDIGALKAVAGSRNYICHELLLDQIHTGVGTQYQKRWDEQLHRMHVRTLAHGDYLVSRWSCEFHEKDSGRFVNRHCYVDRVVDWVFADS